MSKLPTSIRPCMVAEEFSLHIPFIDGGDITEISVVYVVSIGDVYSTVIHGDDLAVLMNSGHATAKTDAFGHLSGDVDLRQFEGETIHVRTDELIPLSVLMPIILREFPSHLLLVQEAKIAVQKHVKAGRLSPVVLDSSGEVDWLSMAASLGTEPSSNVLPPAVQDVVQPVVEPSDNKPVRKPKGWRGNDDQP